MPEIDSISVIIPVYNGENFIKETIESVLAQSHKNLEVIVVDDGSNDNTIEIVEYFGDKIQIFKMSNSGVAAARNFGVTMAKGNWIAFLDADDIWAPRKLERQFRATRRYNWSYTDTKFIGGANDGKLDSYFTKKHEGNVLEKLVQGNFISTSTVMIKRETFIQVGGFDEALRSIQDWELWVRVAKSNPIAYINEPLTMYRIHQSSTSRRTRETLPNHLKVIDIIFSRVGRSNNIAKLKPHAKATSCGICSYIAEEEGDASFAVKCAFDACRFEPFNLSRWSRLVKMVIKWSLRRKKYET